jgi:hypothetical protein
LYTCIGSVFKDFPGSSALSHCNARYLVIEGFEDTSFLSVPITLVVTSLKIELGKLISLSKNPVFRIFETPDGIGKIT